MSPVSTYRVQFHRNFTFRHLHEIIPYLQQLGIKTLYASPVFHAVPGSTHGYDGLHPNRINPEIGTLEELRQLSKKLHAAGISWLQDIVPNHMAFDHRNEWLMDVFEKGKQSRYAQFFDIGWTSNVYEGKIMVPFLGSTLEEAVAKEEVRISYNGRQFLLQYFETAYPLHPRSYERLLGSAPGAPQAVQQLLAQMHGIHEVEDPRVYAEQWNEFLQQLSGLCRNDVVRNFLGHSVEAINKDKEQLWTVITEQHYRLCHWQETDRQINYRRFFTVNGLICLNIHDEAVLKEHHQLVIELVKEGVIDGLRIDHIDGLYDPAGYLEQLRKLCGENTYIIVEKILERKETLPTSWPLEGNTGYDFLAMVNNALTQKRSEEPFTQFYFSIAGDHRSIGEQLREKKAAILYQHMKGELYNLTRLFIQSSLADDAALAEAGEQGIKDAIAAFLIFFPVYRFYGNRLPLEKEEKEVLQDVFDMIRQVQPALSPSLQLLEAAWLKKPDEEDATYNERALHFYQRCMQFTGPLMAKGMEDTLMYTFHRFIGHNEVGDTPEAFGLPPADFHQKMIERQKAWNLSLNATSTHDTKRGEDVRARLNVLTDRPHEWLNTVERWRKENASLKKNGMPAEADEYFIYQTMVGAHPLIGEDEDSFADRLGEYLQKALREGKQHSNWAEPNEAYEKATKEFAAQLLDKKRPFWKSFVTFQKSIADFGILNSLVQTVMKFTCPGIPDVYQGCEGWDLSLVDPDNRRPVDYKKRQSLLQAFENKNPVDLANDLWEKRSTGAVKLWLVQQLLCDRKEFAVLFDEGEYLPLTVDGKYKNQLMAYARRKGADWYLVAIPLHLAAVTKKDPALFDWKDTIILLPPDAPSEWENRLFGNSDVYDRTIKAAELFNTFPVGLLKGKGKVTGRSAGILLHITSLPTPFGIGDLGPSAKSFADFLHRSGQRYWQLLPINPTEEGQGHSPYSSISSRAGNTLLISPEELVKDGLLHADDLIDAQLPATDATDYGAVEKTKSILFEKAFARYKKNEHAWKKDFVAFCEMESSWLEDYAAYLIIRKQHDNKPWYEWPEEYRLRDKKTLAALKEEASVEIEKISWLQFIFQRQWKQLRNYCNRQDVLFLGDLPIYVSYDSADVWSHRELFALDEEGQVTGAAGVPPDAFSDDGQLWGMPVFRWDVLKKRGYDWWIDRLRRNTELFDLVRLDHFRAFADYWEVPAGEETAKGGSWKRGPGRHFFDAVKEAFGELPFIAEDLGEVNEDVFQLRDEFGLAGMKVLQFAFDESMAKSDYIPHNYTKHFLVYTGTHDNNTVRGWWRKDADEAMRQRVQEYAGVPVTEENVHEIFGRLAYASVAETAILPLQDVIGFDESARMNKPASTKGNWNWRLLPEQLREEHELRLKKWCRIYNR